MKEKEVHGMLPAIVFPFHDADGLMFAHLETITPQLKELFAQAFVSISPLTQQTQMERINQLKADEFFRLNFNEPNTMIGDHFLAVYQNAVTHSSPEKMLHLCTIDRVVFALQSEHKEQFVTDIKGASNEDVPVLFQRSQAAWETHPRNYREIEHLAIRAGEILFNQSLDFVWCHLVIQSGQLKEILPHVKHHDLRVVVEMILLLKDKLQTKEVDWLAWEDPFIFSRDLDEMKAEFENSRQEDRKRLQYTIASLQLLFESIQ
ncbi:MAG: hypothetical protein JXM69_02910 [Anaerolineae bacterium]|nr:hypothetical protein [Anaerolineae bacterium]